MPIIVSTGASGGGSSVADGITKTVGPGAEDFSTIQEAIDWFKDYSLIGACKVDITAGTYAEQLDLTDLICGSEASLELEGDTRVLAGISYVDGADCNEAGLANGGSGVITLANGGNNITVVGSVSNPDFDADGWTTGDKVLIKDNTGVVAEYTLGTAMNQILVLTVAAPALGNDGTSIMLIPSVRVEKSIGDSDIVLAKNSRGIVLDGIFVKSTGTDVCIKADYMSMLTLENVAAQCASGNGVYADRNSTIIADGGAVSVWECDMFGYTATRNSFIDASYSVSVDCPSGYVAMEHSGIYALDAIATESSSEGFWAYELSYIMAIYATARQCTVGYYAQKRGYIDATATNANNGGNGADYDPAANDTQGNSLASITWN